MKKKILKLIHFWNEDRSLSAAFFMLLLYIFILIPLLSEEGVGAIIIKIVYSIILGAAILSVAKQKKTVIIISFFAIVGLVVTWLTEIEHSRFVFIVNDLCAIFYNSLFAIAILIKTFQPGDINFQRIQGSIVVYLLFGLIFAHIFHTIYLISGISAFNNISGTDFKGFLYYSFVTLTTVGYGDISPVAAFARSLANFEALIGQLYPAILIARLVSMEFESSKEKKGRA